MEDKDINEQTEAAAKACGGCCGNKEGGCACKQGREGGKLDVYDWLSDVVQSTPGNDLVEVRFKNTRKDYYLNASALSLKTGDIVAVEGSPGHDIGEVILTGELVKNQIVKNRYRPKGEFKKIYRKAKPNDIEKWQEAMALEHKTMIRSRQIVSELGLNMKIGDVEYQGDKTKGIFYYIAEGRVDFRELIKVLASNFRIRIEMKQIGARQEAGRIGGIGPCGRELCCSSWMSNFKSVSTSAARTQEVSLNPQKLAGQCGKLKCCMNYELDAYEDARKDFPSASISPETEEGKYNFVKSDTFKRKLYYFCVSDRGRGGMKEVSVDRAKEVIAMNKRGEIPERLVIEEVIETTAPDFNDVLSDDDSLTRFDKPKQKSSGNRRNNRNNNRRRSSNRQKDNDNKANAKDRSARPNKPNKPAKANARKDGAKPEGGEENKKRAPRNNNNRRKPRNANRKPKEE